MNPSAIRKRLYDYIKVAEDKKVKALYTIIESDINEMDSWHKDEQLLAELEKRSSDLKLGIDKGIRWEKLKRKIDNNIFM